MPQQPAAIHPSAVIGPGVSLGSGVTVGPGAVLLGPLTIGDACWIGPLTVIGAPAEMAGTDHGRAWDGALVGAGVTIGAGTVVREHVTIHQGHDAGTVIGDGCYLMNRVYIAHDGRLADLVTLASDVTLGGHVHVGTRANLGMGSTVHQRRRVGPLAMVGMNSTVTRDVPPFATAYGTPCRVAGCNTVGLARAGLGDDEIRWVTDQLAGCEVGGPPAGVAALLRAWDTDPPS